jgi:hypothetical protein
MSSRKEKLNKLCYLEGLDIEGNIGQMAEAMGIKLK